MSYGLKYKIELTNKNDKLVEIEMHEKDYTGSWVYLDSGAIAPELVPDLSDHFRGTSLLFSVEAKDDAGMPEFFVEDPRRYKVVMKYSGVVEFIGFLVPEVYEDPYVAAPFDIELTATDGLGLLKNIDFDLTGYHSDIACIDHILRKTGHELPVSVAVDVQYLGQPTMNLPAMAYARTNTAKFYSDKGEPDNCYDALKKILASYGLELYVTQWRNRWLVFRTIDLQGEFVTFTNAAYTSRGSLFAASNFGKNQPCDAVGSLNRSLNKRLHKVRISNKLGRKDSVLPLDVFEQELVRTFNRSNNRGGVTYMYNAKNWKWVGNAANDTTQWRWDYLRGALAFVVFPPYANNNLLNYIYYQSPQLAASGQPWVAAFDLQMERGVGNGGAVNIPVDVQHVAGSTVRYLTESGWSSSPNPLKIEMTNQTEARGFQTPLPSGQYRILLPSIPSSGYIRFRLFRPAEHSAQYYAFSIRNLTLFEDLTTSPVPEFVNYDVKISDTVVNSEEIEVEGSAPEYPNSHLLFANVKMSPSMTSAPYDWIHKGDTSRIYPLAVVQMREIASNNRKPRQILSGRIDGVVASLAIIRDKTVPEEPLFWFKSGSWDLWNDAMDGTFEQLLPYQEQELTISQMSVTENFSSSNSNNANAAQASAQTSSGTTRGTSSRSSSSWVNITGKPETFPPSAHTHIVSEVAGLQSALDAKAKKEGDITQDFHVKDLHIAGQVNQWLAQQLVVEDARIQVNRKQAGAVADSGLVIFDKDTSSEVSRLVYDVNAAWRFDDNLGIGVSPTERLHVAGNGLFEGNLLSSGNVRIGAASQSGGYVTKSYIQTFGGGGTGAGFSGIEFNTGAYSHTGVLALYTSDGNPSTRYNGLVVDNVGRVAIGKSTGAINADSMPTEALDVAGNALISGAVTAGGDVGGDGVFVGGFAGSNWLLEKAKNHLTVDRLTVRGRMDVYELVVNQIRATNGSLWVSDAMKVDSANAGDGFYRLFFDTDNGAKPITFAVNDIIRAQKFDGRNVIQVTGRVSYVDQAEARVSLVTAGFGDWDGSPSELEGLDFVRIGNTDPNSDRQGALYLTSSDSNAPYMDVLDGVNSASFAGKTKVRLGRLDGITDPDLGALSGYGLYTENGYFKGKIQVTGGNAATKADVDAVQVGGRNLILNSNFSKGITHWGSSGGNTITLTGDGIECEIGTSTSLHPRQSITLSISPNESLVSTVILKVEVGDENAIRAQFLSGANIIFTPVERVEMGNGWYKLIGIHTNGPTARTVSSIFGLFGYSNGDKFSVKSFKLEKGNRATDWTPAPEDVEAGITSITTRVENTLGLAALEGINQTLITGNKVRTSLLEVTDIVAAGIKAGHVEGLTLNFTKGKIGGINIEDSRLIASKQDGRIKIDAAKTELTVGDGSDSVGNILTIKPTYPEGHGSNNFGSYHNYLNINISVNGSGSYYSDYFIAPQDLQDRWFGCEFPTLAFLNQATYTLKIYLEGAAHPGGQGAALIYEKSNTTLTDIMWTDSRLDKLRQGADMRFRFDLTIHSGTTQGTITSNGTKIYNFYYLNAGSIIANDGLFIGTSDRDCMFTEAENNGGDIFTTFNVVKGKYGLRISNKYGIQYMTNGINWQTMYS